MAAPRARRPGLAGVLVASLLLAAPPAAAHANLVTADPAPNTRLDASPDRLVLAFSEPLDETYTGVDVVGPDGTDRAEGATIAGDDRRRLEVDLAPLPDGLHTVRWRTLSAADGHTKSGVYLLAVNASLAPPTDGGGNGTAPGANATAPEATGSAPGPGEALLRGLAFLGAALAVGTPLALLALPPLTAAVVPERRLQALAALGAGLAAAGSLALLAFLAARVGTGLGAAAATTNGSRTAARAALHALGGLLLAGTLLTGDESRRGALLGAGALAGAAGLLATSMAGHAAGLETARTLALGLDWLHQLSVSFWVAGVVLLLASLASRRPRDRDVAVLVRRLSPLFVAAVVVIVATGTYASWRHLTGWSDLWTTTYGQALTAKILLLVPLMILGAHHRYRLLPRLEARAGDVRRALRRSVAAEALLMVVVLGAAGLLTNVAPPSAGPAGDLDLGADGNATDGGTPDRGLEGVLHEFEADGYAVAFAVRPQPVRVGAQNVTVRVGPGNGSLPDRAEAVLNLKPPSDPYGEGDSVDLTRWRNDTWSREGPVFAEAGQWRVLLAFQGKGVYVQDEFTVEVK